ncbi:MFS transporter [Marmoricola endophyticus]|uniref:MFS transporter n=1 Tax=Marmoricola endophyticus TaxID=2040280 RepID=A0A917BE76_9ACTN|nr:MFS transporter [Marmoricola endophyticus]GGF39690.1 MFS transporter [Marmoricola endophyticus]
MTAILALGPDMGSSGEVSVRHERGFWVVAAVFALVMAFATVPTPLWPIYEADRQMSQLTVTVAFAAYAVGVLVSLFLLGHVSDWVGRRRLLLAAVGAEVVSAGVFLLWPATPGILVARVVCGVGVGMITATATAHLAELHALARPGASPRRAALVSTAANIGGLGLGAFLGGVLAAALPSPLVSPYAVFGVLMLLLAVLLTLAPETVERDPSVRYRPQRVVVPSSARRRYLGAGVAGFGIFMSLGLFTALAPTLLTRLGISRPALTGAAVFAVFVVAATTQMLVTLDPPGLLRAGLPLLALGMVVLAVGVDSGVSAVFVVGALVCGAGIGIGLKGALGTGLALGESGRSGEATAGIFLAAYLGITLPIVGIGLLTQAGVALAAAVTGFAVAVVVVLGLALAMGARPRGGTVPAGS